MRWRDTSGAPAGAVTPVEIFFDIVFVFTLTQLTRTLEADLTLPGVGRILLVFCVLWWMYGGYAWLTNHVPPRRPSQKLLLFAGMAGFFVAAIGIPGAFSETGIIFGTGYFIVICVHLLLFTQADALAGVARLAPFNIGAALLVLAAGFQRGTAVYVFWLAAFVLMAVVPYLVPRLSWVGAARSFHITPAHFVERHALLLIIALGESVIAIGMGVDTSHLGAGMLGMIVLALLLPSALWWAYFTDVPAAERALHDAQGERRSLLSTKAYFFAHIPVLLGIIVAAAGIHSAIAHPADPATPAAAAALSGGVALFLFGMAHFRRSLRIASVPARLLAGLAILTTIPVGLLVSSGAQLAAVVVVMIAMLARYRREHAPPAQAGA
ncbi:MAG TPA: low temperature requirement protein A [Gemmatimonadaceae bacterium]|nr:low temperature requirement protein A [Gemmatimonadaceae bacterium]